MVQGFTPTPGRECRAIAALRILGNPTQIILPPKHPISQHFPMLNSPRASIPPDLSTLPSPLARPWAPQDIATP